MTRLASRPLSLLVLVIAVLGSAPAHAFSLFQRFEGDVVVVTDFTAEGRLQSPVSPQTPVYFKGLSLGNKLGSIGGDREPDVKKMTDVTTKLLRRQGFLGSPGPDHPPTLFLVISWGYMSGGGGEKLRFLGYNPDDDIAFSPNPSFLGPEVFRRGMRSRETQTILEYADEPLYGILVTAFEYNSANTDKPIVYWQTRIAFPARATNMAESLPKMLTVAAAQIGKSSDKPVLRDMDDFRKAEAVLGDLEVLGYGAEAEPARK